MAPSANPSSTAIWPLELEPEVHRMIENRQTFDILMVNIPSCVEKYLYLGSPEAACDPVLLRESSICVILTLSLEPIEEKIEGIRYFHLPIDDHPHENIITKFDIANKLLEQCVLHKMPVLVHCTASFSACSSIMCAYLMKRLKKNCDKTLLTMKKRSPLILPNYGFLNQLHIYEGMKCAIDSTNSDYRYFMLSHLMYSFQSMTNIDNVVPEFVRYDESFTHYFNLTLVPDVFLDRFAKALSYHCKSCHQYLFNELHVVKGPDWKKNCKLEKSCLSFVIEPMSWMFEGDRLKQPSIVCPQCQTKIGVFNFKGTWCDTRKTNQTYCSKHPTETHNLFYIHKVCIVSTNQSHNVQPATIEQYEEILHSVFKVKQQ